MGWGPRRPGVPQCCPQRPPNWCSREPGGAWRWLRWPIPVPHWEFDQTSTLHMIPTSLASIKNRRWLALGTTLSLGGLRILVCRPLLPGHPHLEGGGARGTQQAELPEDGTWPQSLGEASWRASPHGPLPLPPSAGQAPDTETVFFSPSPLTGQMAGKKLSLSQIRGSLAPPSQPQASPSLPPHSLL